MRIIASRPHPVRRSYAAQVIMAAPGRKQSRYRTMQSVRAAATCMLIATCQPLYHDAVRYNSSPADPWWRTSEWDYRAHAATIIDRISSPNPPTTQQPTTQTRPPCPCTRSHSGRRRRRATILPGHHRSLVACSAVSHRPRCIYSVGIASDCRSLLSDRLLLHASAWSPCGSEPIAVIVISRLSSLANECNVL